MGLTVIQAAGHPASPGRRVRSAPSSETLSRSGKQVRCYRSIPDQCHATQDHAPMQLCSFASMHHCNQCANALMQTVPSTSYRRNATRQTRWNEILYRESRQSRQSRAIVSPSTEFLAPRFSVLGSGTRALICPMAPQAEDGKRASPRERGGELLQQRRLETRQIWPKPHRPVAARWRYPKPNATTCAHWRRC